LLLKTWFGKQGARVFARSFAAPIAAKSPQRKTVFVCAGSTATAGSAWWQGKQNGFGEDLERRAGIAAEIKF